LNKLKQDRLEKAKKIRNAQAELEEISGKFPSPPVASQFARSHGKKDYGNSYSNDDEDNDNGGPKDGEEARRDQDMSMCEEEFDCEEVAEAIRRSTQYSHPFDCTNGSTTGSSVDDYSNEENVTPATANRRTKRIFGRNKK
jgi:hypothetical protein